MHVGSGEAGSTTPSAPSPRGTDSPDTTAVIGRSQTRPDRDLTWAELHHLVARIRIGLEAAGVRSGDRVAACLPNIPETLAAMLACASLGAVWTCCAPEMGVTGILDRLAQIDPVVLLAIDGYRYGRRTIERRDENEAIRAGLPTLARAIWLGYLHPDGAVPDGWTPWEELASESGPAQFTPVAVDHPLYVLFSSGTTGKPKPIVHGHGGILLEHAKVLGLHFDLGPDDRFFWYTTTGWMMWNFCMSGLLVGSAVVTFDGDPAWPEPDALWATIAETATTCGGVGAGYLVAGMKAGRRPGAGHDLQKLRTLGSTGSPLPAAAARWVYDAVAADVLLASLSGGTDVCTGFVGGSPLHPVWAGEISCRCLGAAVEVFDDEGRAVVGEEGELVLTAPLPSMPVGFWGDADGSRYHATYFERFPRAWAHGDRATLTARGTCIITGRSDGTLNRGGVRIGTAEFYDVVERFDEVADSLVVHLEDPGGRAGRGVAVPGGGGLRAGEDRESRGRRARRPPQSGLTAGAVAPARPRPDGDGPPGPPHAVREETGGSGQTDPRRACRSPMPSPWRRSPILRAWSPSWRLARRAGQGRPTWPARAGVSAALRRHPLQQRHRRRQQGLLLGGEVLQAGGQEGVPAGAGLGQQRLACRGHRHSGHPPVGGVDAPLHQALFLQPGGDAGHGRRGDALDGRQLPE